MSSEHPTWSFAIVLDGPTEMTDDIADALFEAGLDDGSPGSRGGVCSVWVDREAATLNSAIRSAVDQVRTAGFGVARVEMDEEAVDSIPAAI